MSIKRRIVLCGTNPFFVVIKALAKSLLSRKPHPRSHVSRERPPRHETIIMACHLPHTSQYEEAYHIVPGMAFACSARVPVGARPDNLGRVSLASHLMRTPNKMT